MLVYGIFDLYYTWKYHTQADRIRGLTSFLYSLVVLLFSIIGIGKPGTNFLIYHMESSVWTGLVFIGWAIFTHYMGFQFFKRTKKTWTVFVLFPIIIGLMMLMGYFKIWGGDLPPVDLRKNN